MKKVILLALVATLLLSCVAGCAQTPEHIHEYGEWIVTKNPTATEEGEQARYCACGETQTGVIPMIDETDECKHIWNTVTTAPTCTSVGYDIMTCPLCNKSVRVNETAKIDHTYSDSYTFNNDSHWFACTVCGCEKGIAF